jgi:TonB family protein
MKPFLLPVLLSLAAALSACALAVPIVIGPADLDDSSAQAPRCGPQPYPFNALMNAEYGNVVVTAEVGPGGQVGHTSLSRTVDSPFLNSAALAAVRSCRFTASGAPRRVDVTVVYAIHSPEDKLPRGVVRIGLRPGAERP